MIGARKLLCFSAQRQNGDEKVVLTYSLKYFTNFDLVIYFCFVLCYFFQAITVLRENENDSMKPESPTDTKLADESMIL